jgi:hypothetical protein
MDSSIDFDKLVIPSLVPFHRFSPILKSPRIAVPYLPSSRIFNLILSFPLLEDLAMIDIYDSPADNGDRPEEDKTTNAVQPSCPPRYTGTLELYLKGGMEPFTHRLLSRLGDIHFRKLTLTWFHEEDSLATMALMKGCFHTLESLEIYSQLFGMST